MENNYKTLKLEKGMYKDQNKSFSEILEELDPSENYKDTPLSQLDAFQRQLKRFDIKVKGINSDTVSKFFQTSDSQALFPEYVSRSIYSGIEEDNDLKSIIANNLIYDFVIDDYGTKDMRLTIHIDLDEKGFYVLCNFLLYVCDNCCFNSSSIRC